MDSQLPPNLCIHLQYIVKVGTSNMRYADSTGAYDSGVAQARSDYYGTAAYGVNCPQSWDNDYCALFKAGYAVEWNVQKILRQEIGVGR